MITQGNNLPTSIIEQATNYKPPRTFLSWLIGHPLSTADAPHQTIGKAVGLAVFASYALSSTAYATQEILGVIAAAGAIAYGYLFPVSIAIITLLAIVTISYEQTIHAYPGGGGAYIVASDNLGEGPAQTAGAALLTDYILTAAVSDEPRFSAYQLGKLAVVSADGGAPRVLTSLLDRPVSGQLTWSGDGMSLMFLVSDDRAQYVGRVAVSGGQVQKLTTGRRVVNAMSAGPNGALAVLASSNEELPEVHALERGSLRRLSHQNDAWLSEVALDPVEDFTSTSKDGTVVNCDGFIQRLVADPAS